MGCVESVGPDDENDVDSADENVGAARSALATCVTIQRGGTGNIQDTLLSADYPGWATGNEPSLYTGKSGGGGVNRSLLRADLGSIPAGATVTSAILSLSASWTDANNQVGVHPVLSPWSEATATAGNFDAATGIGAAAVATFAAGNGGTKSVDVTGLVAQWVNGSLPNNGLALQEPAVQSHLFWSSETSMKPSLTVCYEPVASGPYVWSQSYFLQAIRGDANGNTIGVGPLYGSVSFGSGTVTSTYTTGQNPSPTEDIYVTKFGPTGTPLWTKRFGDEYIINPDNARDQDATAVTTDAAGNIYVSGTFKGVVVSAASPGYTESSYPAVFALKLDPSGNVVWSSGQYAFGWGTTVKRVAVDGGNGMFAFGNCSVAVGAYCENGSFVMKENPNGGTAWTRGCRPTSGFGHFDSWALDGAGSSIMASVFSSGNGSIDCNSGAVPLQHANDLVLVKHDNAGNQTWIKQFPVVTGAIVHDMAADASNNLYLSLYVNPVGSVTFGATTLTGGVYIVKLDQDANLVWATHAPGNYVRRIGLLPNGKVAAAGIFSGSIDFGAGSVPGYGANDYFVWKVNPDGTSTNSGLVIGGSSDDNEIILSTDGLGGVEVRGQLFGSNFNFGQGPKGPGFTARVAP